MKRDSLNENFWNNRYFKNDTGWDLGAISPAIKKWFDTKKNKDLQILIPGAGKGHEVKYGFDHGFNNIHYLDISNGAEGWQLSNPAILSMAAIKASLELFRKVGMNKLRMKSINLTGYLEYLILHMNNKNIDIITPKDPNQRGCQLSIKLNNSNKSLHENLRLNNATSNILFIEGVD